MKKLMVSEVRSMKMIAGMMVMMAGMGAWAQAPAGPVMSPATAEAAHGTQPQAPAANAAAPADPFPPVNLKNFTASSPTTAEVNAFLKQSWGFDDNRIWSIAAILKTQAPGVVRVVVFAADKTHPEKVSRNEFLRHAGWQACDCGWCDRLWADAVCGSARAACGRRRMDLPRALRVKTC